MNWYLIKPLNHLGLAQCGLDGPWVLGCRSSRVGVGTGSRDPENSSPYQTGLVWFSRGQGSGRSWARMRNVPRGPWGGGRGRLQPHKGSIVSSLHRLPRQWPNLWGAPNENKKRGRGRLRRGTHWLGQSLGEGVEGARTPRHKGEGGGGAALCWAPLLDPSFIQFNKGGGWSW